VDVVARVGQRVAQAPEQRGLAGAGRGDQRRGHACLDGGQEAGERLIDAPLVLAFLKHLEEQRGRSASTRNARLAAIRSFMRYVELRVPSIIEQSRRVLAIPTNKTDAKLVRHLSQREMEAVLRAPT